MDRLSAEFPPCSSLPSRRDRMLRWARPIPTIGLAALVSTILLGGCGKPGALPAAVELPASAVMAQGSPSALRVRSDRVRDRNWALTLDHVEVYDRVTRRLIRRIDLPPWWVADRVCQPDIVFDARGTAFISHNIEPKLWQIHADTFELKEHAFRLVGKEHLDIGFSSLTFASDGTLIAKASTGDTIWRMDFESATAHEVEPVRGDGAQGICVESM
jgi:hypothetical protein